MSAAFGTAETCIDAGCLKGVTCFGYGSADCGVTCTRTGVGEVVGGLVIAIETTDGNLTWWGFDNLDSIAVAALLGGFNIKFDALDELLMAI